HALDLAYSLDTGLVTKVMDDVDAKRGVHAAARKGQLLRAPTYDTAVDVGVAVLDRVLGDFKPPCFQAGHNSHQIAHEKALGTPTVQHSVPWFKPEMRGNIACDRDPAAVVAVAAVALLSRPIEIFAPKSARNNSIFRLPLLASDEIAFCARIFCEQIDLSHWLRLSCPRASLPSLRRATSNVS